MLKEVIFILLIAAFAAIFYYYPEIDILISSLFYNTENGFYLKDKWWVIAIYKSAPIICAVFVIVATLYALKTLRDSKSFSPKYYKKIIYVTLVCLIGPGLIVHNVFKDNFGRPRPKQIEEFGGILHYQKPFFMSKQCHLNCSFPSGHASVGFMFFSLAFIHKGRKKLYYNCLAIFLGLVIGMIRIIQGGHFLSDVIFAGMVVYATAYILDKIIKPLNSNPMI